MLLSTEARREEIRMTTMTKQFISFAFVVALSFLSSKADIDLAQEQYEDKIDMKGIILHDPTAAIGEGEKQIKTPWMIMNPDGKSVFANDFTTNAISVVSENGTDYYTHIEDENGGRTNVIHFTVNENGIPSKNGDVIDTTESGEENNAEKMKIRKLIGVKDGYLCFYPTDEYGIPFIYHPQKGMVPFASLILDLKTGEKQKFLSYDPYHEWILYNAQYIDSDEVMKTETCMGQFNGESGISLKKRLNDVLVNGVMHYPYIGDSDGKIYMASGWSLEQCTQLPGSISCFSKNRRGDVFATTPATNAFYNVTKGQYNVVTDQNGNVKPMIPKTKDGLIKVIDNRRNGGKFLCITTKGAHTIDE